MSAPKVDLLTYTSPPFVGAAIDSLLTGTAGVGEGVWVPVRFAKVASLEIEGTFSALSLQLLGSNSQTDPGNQYTVTVGGSATQNDVITLHFANPNLPNGTEDVVYTVPATPSVNSIAAGIAAAINADTNLAALGITALAASAIITVSYPSAAPPAAAEGASPSQPAFQNNTVITDTLSGGASETIAIANASSGQAVGSAITAKGITAIATFPGWIKAQINTFTGSVLTAGYHGAA